MYHFWTKAFTPQHLQHVSSAWKTTADTLEKMSGMTKCNPVFAMAFAMGADMARLQRDLTDQMVGDIPIIPKEITELLGLQEVVLSSEDRLETRRIGREERRGIAGLGPSPKMDTL